MLTLAVDNTRGEASQAGMAWEPCLKRSEHRDLLAWWEKERGSAPCVDRARITPRDFAPHMPWMFVIGQPTGSDFVPDEPAVWRFAGSLLTWVFNSRIMDGRFERFWTPSSREAVNNTVAAARARPRPFALQFSAVDLELCTPCDFEMIALPMLPKSGRYLHFIGSIRPLQAITDVSSEGFGPASLVAAEQPADTTARPLAW